MPPLSAHLSPPPITHPDLVDASFRDRPVRSSASLNRTLSTHWTDLAVLSFSAPPTLLQPHIPPGTVIDTFEGAAKVSFVGFKFHRTELKGIPSPTLFDFSELNLRTYVRGPEGVPGVVFLRELCPSRIACIVAKMLFNESFKHCPTESAIESDDSRCTAKYSWGAEGSFLSMTSTTTFREFTGADEASFIGNRTTAFTRSRSGDDVERFDIVHRPWRYATAEQIDFKIDPSEFGYPELAPIFSGTPSGMLMDGSAVDVYQYRRC